jgi:hypothetical protein
MGEIRTYFSFLTFKATGNIPSPRAAHSSCCVNLNQLVVYGGATGCKFKLFYL